MRNRPVELRYRFWAARLAIIGGAALIVMCVAPFPFGFLCHEDPS
jgi:hypothetical protein